LFPLDPCHLGADCAYKMAPVFNLCVAEATRGLPKIQVSYQGIASTGCGKMNQHSNFGRFLTKT